MAASKTIGSGEIQAAIARLASLVSSRHAAPGSLLVLGIANGGIELSRRLARALGARCGVVDISFHRDDLDRRPIPRESLPTHLPGDVQGATVLLVDDVLFTGRTVKAALDEVFDHGRPARVELAVLVDRGCRRLPLTADYVGLSLPTRETEKVVVRLDPDSPRRDAIRIEAPGA